MRPEQQHPLFHGSAHTGRGQNAAQSCATGADALRQSALGDKFDFRFAGIHLAAGFFIGADVGGECLFDLLVYDQLATAVLGIAGCAGD